MLCIEGKLTRAEEAISGSLTQDGVISASLTAQRGISASLRCSGIVQGTLTSAPGISASLTGNPIEAYFSFSCPIEYIKSCFSLGGWYNDLGWDNNLGWKN